MSQKFWAIEYSLSRDECWCLQARETPQHKELFFMVYEGISLPSASVRLLLSPCAHVYYYDVDKVVGIWKAAWRKIKIFKKPTSFPSCRNGEEYWKEDNCFSNLNYNNPVNVLFCVQWKQDIQPFCSHNQLHLSPPSQEWRQLLALLGGHVVLMQAREKICILWIDRCL